MAAGFHDNRSATESRSRNLRTAGCDLLEFSREFAVWDPVMEWDGRRWLLCVLAVDRAHWRPDRQFFVQDNHIHGFSSADLNRWDDLGVLFRPRREGERLCAGSLKRVGGLLYYFGSATVSERDDGRLHQEIYLATSSDGVRYVESDGFALSPDPRFYATGRTDPVNGELMWAWRDPVLFRDPESNRFYLYICSGGARWGVPPQVAVAVAETPAGPYRLLPPAVTMQDEHGHEPVRELERVQVSYVHGRYVMTFSAWEGLVDKAWMGRHRSLPPGRISDSTVYVLVADRPEGPYVFADPPVVDGSWGTGLYGTAFCADPRGNGRMFAIGWHPGKFTVEVSGRTPATCRGDGRGRQARVTRSPSGSVSAAAGRGPDFVGVGFPKCGTSWWYEAITRHPRIVRGTKERHYFSTAFTTPSPDAIRQYRATFRRDDGELAGEFSPGVLYYPLAVQRMHRAAPQARIIVLMRNPVDRALSHYEQLGKVRAGIVQPRDIDEFMRTSAFPEALHSGLYTPALERLFRCYDPARVLLLQYERCLSDPRNELRKTWEFLGLDAPEQYDVKPRPAGGRALDPRLRDELVEFYRDDVDELFSRFGHVNRFSTLDPGLWTGFAPPGTRVAGW